MRWKVILMGLAFSVISMPLVIAHSGLYHNYAGSGTGFLILLTILIGSLILYEKIGDTPLGYSVLWIGILIPLYVDLFFPQEEHLVDGMKYGILVIVGLVLLYNYRKMLIGVKSKNEN